ncbi:tail fiber domain-containing protein [Franconibacter daqui]|uniref:tail fiber domain-containing protein n=1 Tax=Franconibacter daqui TaxID=2047724 RepID=UPI002DB76BD7|nr:tail fiber domain-containing protein [Franconibacter daqui]MEB5920889.1 tail fiber domain-containing protein [Franconibacter daqui]
MSAWYRSGTIAVAGKTVTGTGTNWTDNKMGIGPGQALLIPGAGTVKVYEISRVDSATQLTLNDDAGTVSAGQAYAIMSFYGDSVPDFARRLSAQLSYYQGQMDGWQEIMTGTGSIILEAPDGTQVTFSSFKKLTDDLDEKADKVNGAVPVVQGGTGGKDAQTARNNLGLGGDSAPTFSGLSLKTSTSASGILYQEFAIGSTKFRSRSYTERRSDGSNFWTWALANRNNTETYLSFRDDGQLMLSRCMNLGAPVATDWSTLLNNANAPGLFFEARQDNGGASALGSLNFSYLHSGGYKLTTALAMVGRGTSQWASTVMVQGGDGGSAATRYWVFDPVSGDLTNSGGGGWGGSYIFQKAANSDATIKHDIEYGDGQQSYENIKRLKPCTFIYNDDSLNRVRRGIIAQDALREIDREYVKLIPAAPKFDESGNRIDEDDTLALDNNVIMMDTALALNYLIKQFEQAQQEITSLQRELDALKSKE